MLLVHGGGADNAAISWFRLLDPLRRERRVIAPDLPGFGYTEGVPYAETAADMADLLAALLDALAIERVIVCGVSMGGEVAIQFALRHPTRCAGLIAVAAGGLIERYKNPVAHHMAWLATLLPDPILVPLSALANRFVRTALNQMVHDRHTVPPEVVDEFVRESRRPRAGYVYGRYNKAAIGPRRMRNNALGEVHRISVPTLLFHGTADPLVDPAGSVTAADRIDGAELVLVEKCGHWAQLEMHERFLTAVASLTERAEADA
nr:MULTISPECIES: alpha/beta hydrolase [Actinoalloteichus]